ncbi:MAG: YdcF family protein [Brachymonas sp.]|nr:YdcF family protein [Brachymonas sp.]
MAKANPLQTLWNALVAGKVAPWWLHALAAVGGVLLLAHAAYLIVAYAMFHFGIMLITAMGLVFVGLWFWVRLKGWPACHAWLRARRVRWWLWRLGWSGFVLWLASVALFFAFISHGHAVDIAKADMGGKQVILVLGGGAPRCQASPAVQTRLDKGLEVAQRLPQATVMVTGGKDLLRDCTEGQVMGDYLRAHQLAPQRIVQEERSTSTFENLVFSGEILQQQGFDKARDTLIIVTHEFHALRARHIAYKQGFQNVASENAVTPLYARYTAWLREYFTYISGWLLNEF